MRNAAPTQSSSSSEAGPTTLDRYTETPCVGNRVHQRARQVQQPAAPQHAIGEFKNVQADCVAAGRLVVADKALGLQRAQNVVGGAAMEARGAGDLARLQRPLRGVQRAQHCGRRDDRADRFARMAPAGSPAPLAEGSRWSARLQDPVPGGRVLSNPLVVARPSSRLLKRVDLYKTT